MRTMTKVIFYDNAIPEGITKLCRAIGCDSDVVEIHEASFDRQMIVVKLDDSDVRAKLLLDELARHSEDPIVIRRDQFTAEELARASLVSLWSLPASEIGGDLGEKSTFDLTGSCPRCHATARQTAPYLVDDEEDLQKLEGRRLVVSYWQHFLVDDRLADTLMAANVTGLSFHNVYALIDKKRQVKLRWKQVQANHVLPPVAPQTTGLHQQYACAICNRTGYHPVQHEPLRLAYKAADLSSSLDVNNSWEFYGAAYIEDQFRPSKLSTPATLITPKVMQIFQDAGVIDVEYLPIRVVEE